MPYNEIHMVLINCMYGMLVIITFIVIERMIYYISSVKDGKSVEATLRENLSEKKLKKEMKEKISTRKTPQSQIIYEIIKGLQGRQMNHDAMTCFVQAIYFSLQSELNRFLWIIETITILAPLFGLLGTICGIIDTFHTLAMSGNSDPAAVSKGIGDALFATGIGISIAIYGLAFYNYFSQRVTHINTQLKMISMVFLSQREEFHDDDVG